MKTRAKETLSWRPLISEFGFTKRRVTELGCVSLYRCIGLHKFGMHHANLNNGRSYEYSALNKELRHSGTMERTAVVGEEAPVPLRKN